MAAIAVFVVQLNMEAVTPGNYRVLCDLVVEGQFSPDPYRFDLEVSFGEGDPKVINQMILAAGISKATSEGFTVTNSDAKLLYAVVTKS